MTKLSNLWAFGVIPILMSTAPFLCDHNVLLYLHAYWALWYRKPANHLCPQSHLHLPASFLFSRHWDHPRILSCRLYKQLTGRVQQAENFANHLTDVLVLWFVGCQMQFFILWIAENCISQIGYSSNGDKKGGWVASPSLPEPQPASQIMITSPPHPMASALTRQLLHNYSSLVQSPPTPALPVVPLALGW